MKLGRTYFEALLKHSRSLPPTLKVCWRPQGSPSSRHFALKPQQELQHQQAYQLRWHIYESYIVKSYHLLRGFRDKQAGERATLAKLNPIKPEINRIPSDKPTTSAGKLTPYNIINKATGRGVQDAHIRTISPLCCPLKKT